MTGILSPNRIYFGDCRVVLTKLPNNSIDLIVTSPPYADKRAKSYGGVNAEKYLDWFLPISKELFRVLKPTGSFILNIKEHAKDGEKHTYVLELILAMKKQGWRWTEEYIWYKQNAMPGKWKFRFRDAWERCLHFTKSKKIKMYQDRVKVPIGDWAKIRMKHLNEKDLKRNNSATNSGLGRNLANWIGKRKVYPSNVLLMPTVCANLNHSATFPEVLPAWFIKLFTNPDDVVLDPFAGCGTTPRAAIKLGRRYIGIEINEQYWKNAVDSINEFPFLSVQRKIEQ